MVELGKIKKALQTLGFEGVVTVEKTMLKQAYKEKYGSNPDTFAALSYDATQLLMKAIEKAGSTDPQAITKALAETKDFDGVTGTFSMGADHTPVKSAVVIEFQNGQEVSAQEYSAD